MAKTVVALMETPREAENVVRDLTQGFALTDLGVPEAKRKPTPKG